MQPSYTEVVAPGNTSVFSVPFPYIDKSHIAVTLDGTPTNAVEWQTDSAIELGTPPAAGTLVGIARQTPGEAILSFRQGNLDPGDLNVSYLQSLYVAQEALDAARRLLNFAGDLPYVGQVLAAVVAGANTSTTKAAEAAASAALAATQAIPQLTTAQLLLTLKGGASNIPFFCYGDSLTLGYQAPGVISATPYPTAFSQGVNQGLAFATAGPPALTVANRGFTGHTAQQGYDYWITSGKLDQDIALFGKPPAVIVCYGPNDADANVLIASFKATLEAWKVALASRGIALILKTSPRRKDRDYDAKTRPYVEAAREVADRNGLICYDTEQSIGWMRNRWYDLTHLSSQAYAEDGWCLAAMFIGYSGSASRKVGPGDIFYDEDGLTYGGTRYPDGSAVSGAWTSIPSGARAAIGAFYTEDVYPVITTISTVPDVTRTLRLKYSGGQAGVPDVVHAHEGSEGVRKRFVGPRLRKGWRYFSLEAEGGQTSFIESVEFVPAGRLWRDYTPVVKATTGALAAVGTVRARYVIVDGGICHFDLEVPIVDSGTGGTAIEITLPVAPFALTSPDTPSKGVFSGAGREAQILGKSLTGELSDNKTLLVRNYDNSYPGGTGTRLRVSGWYRVA